ncbi:MAG: hypothetical protein ACK50G_02810 [bacterium]
MNTWVSFRSARSPEVGQISVGANIKAFEVTDAGGAAAGGE